MQDRIQWVAVYENGSSLRQVEGPEKKNAYADIDRQNLKRFCLILKEGDSEFLVFTCAFNGDGKKLVWRRRVQRRGEEEIVVHVVGKKGQYVALVMQEGICHLFDNFDENDALLAFPELVDGEK